MGWKSSLCYATLLVLAFHNGARASPPVQVFTSEFPPLATSASTGEPGALHDMVTELSRRTGVPLVVHFVPWRRAIHLSTAASRTAIFPLSRSPERESRYRWLAPLHREHFLFLAPKNSRFSLDDPGKSRHRRVGILRGSVMLAYLKEQGFPNIVEASSVAEYLRFLERGIVDAVFGDRDILEASLKARHRERYAMSRPMRESVTWLGGSPDFTEADAALFQQAMKDMVKDGTHARILRKYSLKTDQ